MTQPSAEPAQQTLRVLLAKPRGFCAGVVRAISIVEQAIERYGSPVYVRHEIVHNRHVVENLRSKGAVFVDELTDIPDGALTVFSAHGVARSVEDEARERALPVIDATCPLVTKVHVQGRRYAKGGRTLLLIGHRGHAEVDGTMGQIDGPIHLVQSVDDVAKLDMPDDTPLAYVTQTRSRSTTRATSSPRSRPASPTSMARMSRKSATPRRTARPPCARSPAKATC